eukprot:g20337.t3
MRRWALLAPLAVSAAECGADGPDGAVLMQLKGVRMGGVETVNAGMNFTRPPQVLGHPADEVASDEARNSVVPLLAQKVYSLDVGAQSVANRP